MINQEIIERAINGRRKINLRMHDTPVGSYILFHPYAIIENLTNDEISVIGLVERHYAANQIDYLKNPTLQGMIEAVILDDQFESNYDWQANFDLSIYSIILRVGRLN